jgi:hypothetical protein
MSEDNSKWLKRDVIVNVGQLLVAMGALGVAGVAAVVAIVFSLQANTIAKESNIIANKANEIAKQSQITAMKALSHTIAESERNEERWQTQHEFDKESWEAQFALNEAQYTLNKVVAKVDISVKYYIADSPDFSEEKDQQWKKTQGYESLKRIPTDYQFVEDFNFQYALGGDSGKKYLFIVFINEGPGIAEEVHITSFKWTPKENEPIPSGREFNRNLGQLGDRAAYALLVDVLEGATDVRSGNVSSITSFLEANVNFEMIELTLKFKDLLGEEEVSPPYYLSRSDETLEGFRKIEPMFFAPVWIPGWPIDYDIMLDQ